MAAEEQENEATMTGELHALEAEVTRFRAWADATFPPAARQGEWEVDYDEWPILYQTATNFINEVPYEQWDGVAIEWLLYVIARDNEVENLIWEIEKHPDNLLFLAKHAIASQERDAKWQIAVALGHLGAQTPQVESLLFKFAHDSDEYVRRRALMALADAGSTHVEALVESAWNAADEMQEYQRMAVLHVLDTVNSPQMESYLVLAEADGRKYLVANAACIRASRNAE